MRIAHRTTHEFDARPAVVRAALTDERLWPALLPGLERLGRYWRFGGELYELHAHEIGEQIVVQAVCLAPPRRTLSIMFQFEDTRVTTRVSMHVVGDITARVWWRARGALVNYVAEACQILTERVRQDDPSQPASFAAEVEPSLAARYPNTVAAFAEMNALDHLERIARLDAVWDGIRQATNDQPSGSAERRTQNTERDDRRRATEGVYVLNNKQPTTDDNQTFDLIYAGGGLALLHAAVMARRYNKKVLLFDRGEVGCAHREWNISRVELEALVEIGLFSWDELRDVVMNEYERGLVRFHDRRGTPTDLWLPTVLNIALDAGMLLQLTRRKLEQAGGTVLDQRLFKRVWVGKRGPTKVCVEVEASGGVIEQYNGRLLLDGMGSASPLALERFAGQPFAGVCPTVGTVVSGLAEGEAADEHNSRIGDILLSVDDAQRGQQYMWEGFPGRGDELTVYLFYYDTLRVQGSGFRGQKRAIPTPDLRPLPPSLMQLFEDYFALLPTYKRPGPEFRHLKPVYGYIPARHSLRRQEAPLLRGVLPIGDSAAQQSPLTFCGFGSHVRNLDRTTSLLNQALHHDLLEPEHLHAVSAYQSNVSLNWVFSRFMQPWGRADDVNKLQNIFLAILNDLGIELAERYFKDRMRWGDYHKMVVGMFFRHPTIVLDAWQVLGLRGCRQWVADYARYSWSALLAWGAQRLGEGGRKALAGYLERIRPAAGLRVRAAFAEWRASSWIAFDGE